jgi:integrase
MAKRKGHLSNGRGTLRIDLRFPAPVGRIAKATGSNESQTKKDIESMLDALARSVPPRYDLLLAIKSGSISLLYALSCWRQGNLNKAPSAELLPPLDGRWRAWLDGKDYSREYKASVLSTLNGLLRQGTEPKVGDLPKLMQAYRVECHAAGHPTQFNRAKAHVQAFVRDTLRKRHELYLEVTDVSTLKEGEGRAKRPQKPEALRAILSVLPQPHRRMAWEMAITGMGPKEYWGTWAIRDLPLPHLHIDGTKRESRVRNVPLPVPLHGPCGVTRDTFEGAWERRINGLGIYDLRRSYAVWLAEAGIPEWRAMIYMGHSAPSQTAKYRESELLQWLEEDETKLYDYAGLVAELAIVEAA